MSTVVPAPEVKSRQIVATTPTPKPWLVPLLLLLVTFAVYLATLRFEFVYDDTFQIANDPWLTWRFIPRYFTQHLWAWAGISGTYWRPVLLLWFLVQRMLFGLNPAGWHAATLALHAAAVVLAYLLTRRLTRDSAAAVIAALIFGLHPALVESVAWVSGSSDPLLALFFVGAFLACMRWRESRSHGWLALTLLLFSLALLVKEPGIILLPVIACYAWITAQGGLQQRFRNTSSWLLPFVPVTAVYLLCHWAISSRFAFVANSATWLGTVLTVPSLLWFYVRLLLVPYPISPEYGLRTVTQLSLSKVVLPLLGLALMFALIAFLARHLRRCGKLRDAQLVRFASAWILLPLLPVLYTKPLQPLDFAHARYLYLSAIGFGMLLAIAIRRLPSTAKQLFGLPLAQGAVAALILVLLAVGAATQQVYWANNLALFARGVEVAPNNPSALTNLAAAFSKREQYDKSIPLLQEALRQDPLDWHANFILGYTLFTVGRYQEAEPRFLLAIGTHPDDVDPDQYMFLAMNARKLGKREESEWAVRQAARRRPDRESYRYALALILEERGKLAEAAPEFEATLKINPANADARARLARIQAALQR